MADDQWVSAEERSEGRFYPSDGLRRPNNKYGYPHGSTRGVATVGPCPGYFLGGPGGLKILPGHLATIATRGPSACTARNPRQPVSTAGPRVRGGSRVLAGSHRGCHRARTGWLGRAARTGAGAVFPPSTRVIGGHIYCRSRSAMQTNVTHITLCPPPIT